MNELATPATTIGATPLSRDHGYIQNSPAPAFWALSPYLIHQHTDSSCSLATATMLLNGARAIDGKGEIGKFVSELGLLERMADSDWRREITPPDGNGISLVALGEKLPRALALYDLGDWSVAVHTVSAADSETADGFRAALTAMEADGDRLVAANYHLATTYGDQWDIGHFSPIGAYDAQRDRVLLLDVWKADYEPSWVPLMQLLAGMTQISPITNNARGYLVLRRR